MIGRSDCAKGFSGKKALSRSQGRSDSTLAIPLLEIRIIRHNSPMTPLLSGDCEGTDRIRPRIWAFLLKDPKFGSNSR
jgi:hypothetical protein